VSGRPFPPAVQPAYVDVQERPPKVDPLAEVSPVWPDLDPLRPNPPKRPLSSAPPPRRLDFLDCSAVARAPLRLGKRHLEICPSFPPPVVALLQPL